MRPFRSGISTYHLMMVNVQALNTVGHAVCFKLLQSASQSKYTTQTTSPTSRYVHLECPSTKQGSSLLYRARYRIVKGVSPQPCPSNAPAQASSQIAGLQPVPQHSPERPPLPSLRRAEAPPQGHVSASWPLQSSKPLAVCYTRCSIVDRFSPMKRRVDPRSLLVWRACHLLNPPPRLPTRARPLGRRTTRA